MPSPVQLCGRPWCWCEQILGSNLGGRMVPGALGQVYGHKGKEYIYVLIDSNEVSTLNTQ